MNLNKIISFTLLYTFSLTQCMEITLVENKSVENNIVPDIHLQKLIGNLNRNSLNVVNIVKEHSHTIQKELTPDNIPLVLNLNQKQIDDLFLATVEDDDLRPLLLSMGADIKARKENGQNCLWNITKKEALTELLNKGAQVNTIDTHGETPLTELFYFEIRNNFPEYLSATQILLEHGADTNITLKYYESLLYRILDYENRTFRLEAAKLLCLHKIDVTKKRENSCSPLIKVIKDGDADLVELFLQNGADKEINTPNYYDECPLHVAMQKDDYHYYSRTRPIVPKIVLLLLQYGAKPNIAYSDGQTMPLHVAVDRDQLDIIKELIKYGANTSHTNKNGFTAYDLAKQRKYKQDILNMLYVVSPSKEHVVHDEKGEPVVIVDSPRTSSEDKSSTYTCCIQ